MKMGMAFLVVWAIWAIAGLVSLGITLGLVWMICKIVKAVFNL